MSISAQETWQASCFGPQVMWLGLSDKTCVATSVTEVSCCCGSPLGFLSWLAFTPHVFSLKVTHAWNN